jgi:Domain of unknown function (DUF4279)
METQIISSFLLSHFQEEPEEITNLLQITPSQTWKTGDLIHPKSRLLRDHNGWEMKPDLNKEDKELESQLLSLIERLNRSWGKLVELTSNDYYCAEISIVINVYGNDVPAINFSPEVIKKIAEINASIDIDLYVLND